MTQGIDNAVRSDANVTLHALAARDDATPESAFETPALTRVTASDADEFGEKMRDWNLELKQLQPGQFGGSLVVLPLGPALVCSGRYEQSLLQQVGVPDDCLNITRPGRGSDPVTFVGHEVAPGEVFVAGTGAECESVTRGVLRPTALSMKLSFLQTQTDWLTDARLLSAKGVKLHSPGPKWTGEFLDAMEWIVGAAAQYPETVGRADVSGSMLDSLLARVNTLGVTDSPLSDDRESRSARRQAVDRAREYIQANLTEPIRLSDLCKHARTQARSLEYGFHEAFGLSPIAYIRATRLHRVRRLLRSTAVRTRSVSEIALDCGFWHLSQFAVDYKRLFAESPSITFRRTHAQLPRADRRGGSMTGLNSTARQARVPGAVAALC
jgi:AraC family ethanolamine operon transcriptional activator